MRRTSSSSDVFCVFAGSRKAYAGSYAIEFFTGARTPVATMDLTVDETVTLSTLPPPRANAKRA